MNIAIIEDDTASQERLYNYILEYHTEHNIQAPTIDIFNDGIHIVDDYNKDYDILYFDIQMNILDGLEAAKIIREKDSEVLIVFVTNYVQWAIDGYKVNAYDFLLKPLTEFSFFEHYSKALDKISQNKDEVTLSIKTNLGIKVFSISTLKYIESSGHYLNFNTSDGVLTTLDTLKKYEDILKDSHFYRINNSYLVNMKHIDSIIGNDVIIDDHHLPISRGRKKDFMLAFNDYIGDPWL